MKFISLILLLISQITVSRSAQVLGPSDPVFAVAGEDVILPCFVKPNTSIVDTRVEWFRLDVKDSVVHLYEDHEDRNTGQIQSYRGRTELFLQELQRGNASLKLSSVKVSDEGQYKCNIQSRFLNGLAVFDVKVEAVGRPPVITVDGFDGSGGLHLQCETEGWFPEPDLEWLDSEGERMSPETTETHRKADGFSVKRTVIVHERDGKFHCRVKQEHHMLETQIKASRNMFNSWRKSVGTISVFLLLSIFVGILIAVCVRKYRAILHLRTHKVNVFLNAETAHRRLIVSVDGKRVRDGNSEPDRWDRTREPSVTFDEYLGVLGKEGFSGCFYYEVTVKEQTLWYVGVASESVSRKGWIVQSPEEGCWTVGLSFGKYQACESSDVPLSLRLKPRRIGVFVDYDKGLVSFYNVDFMTHIFSFTGQLFNEKLYPVVSLGYQSNTNPTPLIICEDY